MRALILGVITGLWAAASLAEDSVWRVAYNSFPPYTVTDASGRPAGYGIDLIRALAAREGARVEFIEVDNPGAAIEALRDGRADLSPVLVETKERAEVAQFSQPHASIRMHGYALGQRAEVLTQRWPDGVRIGVTQGAYSMNVAAQQDGGIIVPLQTNADTLLALLAGEVDAVVFPEVGFRNLIDTIETRRSFRVVSPLLADVKLSIAVSRNAPGLFPIISMMNRRSS